MCQCTLVDLRMGAVLINLAELFQRRPRPPGIRLYDLKIGETFTVRPQYRDYGVVRYPSLSIAPGVIYEVASLRCCYVGVKRTDGVSEGIYFSAGFLRVDPVEVSGV